MKSDHGASRVWDQRALYPSDKSHRKFGHDLNVHPMGDKWDRTFCFDLPATVAENQTITLNCHAEHDRHRGWRSLSYLPSMKICGHMEDDPPAEMPKRPDPFCDKQRASFTAASPSP